MFSITNDSALFNLNLVALGGIFAEKLHASVLNRVQNPARVSDASELTWTGAVHSLNPPLVQLDDLASIRIRAAVGEGANDVFSDFFDVDPLKTYKISAQTFGPNGSGVYYAGVRFYDKDGGLITGGERITQSLAGTQAATTYTGNPFIHNTAGTIGEMLIDTRLVGARVPVGTVPFGDIAQRHNRIPANAARCQLVFRATANTGTINHYFTNVSVSEADAGLITGERLVAGSVDTPHLAANAIKAGNIDVGSLQAVSTNTGSLTVDGNIQSSNFTAGGQAGFQLRADGTAEFNGVVLSRQLMADSGTFDFPNIGNNSGWDFRRDEVVETTAIPLTAWQGLEETYIAAAGFGAGVIVDADTGDIPDVYWGLIAEILPATRWGGNQSVRLLLSLYTKNIVSITGAGGASTFPVEWRIYRVT